MGIFSQNAAATKEVDDAAAIQAAVDYLALNHGGTILLSSGTYNISSLKISDGITLTGDGPDKTVIRSIRNAASLIEMSGGSLMNCKIFGTAESGSGENWKIGRGGKGKRGTAMPASCIKVDCATNGVTIHNVEVYEARYDPLYVRSCNGLRVTNSRFDRAGRNIVSLVGNTDDFIFSDCYFGSLWGLYHVDIEPNDGKHVRNGTFLNCIFDGSNAGKMNTGTWGAFFGLCGDRAEALASRNITVKGCEFNNIWIRVQGVFPEAKFIGNKFNRTGAAFVKVRTNKVGEFRDAVVRDNFFGSKAPQPFGVVAGATFTGKTVVSGNTPDCANDIKITDKSIDLFWEEVHPITKAVDEGISQFQIDDSGEIPSVTMPLQGHRFSFTESKVLSRIRASDNTATKNKDNAEMEVHIDPIIALNGSGLQKIGTGKLEQFKHVPAEGYTRLLFGASSGDVCALMTAQGNYFIFEITAMSKKQIQFRYRSATLK